MARPLPNLPDEGLKEPLFERALAVWNDARGQDLVAARNAITLPALGPCLPWASIVEEVAPDDYIYRLLGTGYRTITQIDLTGKNLGSLTEPSKLPALLRRLALMLDKPMGSFSHFSYQQPNKAQFEFMSIALPIKDIGTEKHRGFFIQQSAPITVKLDEGAALLGPSVPIDLTWIDIGAGLEPVEPF